MPLELIKTAVTFCSGYWQTSARHHQVVIGCRSSPGLALGGMRAHGLLLELDQTDLRFTSEETLSYLERQNLADPALLQSLQRHTES